MTWESRLGLYRVKAGHHGVCQDRLVSRDEPAILSNRLSNEQAIERIVVKRRKGREVQSMVCTNREFLKRILCNRCQELCKIDINAAQADLDRDFPEARGADGNCVSGRGNQASSLFRKAPIASHPPQQQVSVEEKSHD